MEYWEGVAGLWTERSASGYAPVIRYRNSFGDKDYEATRLIHREFNWKLSEEHARRDVRDFRAGRVLEQTFEDPPRGGLNASETESPRSAD